MPRKNGQGMNWIRRDKRLAIHIRDRFECVWCEKDLRDAEPGDLQLDHFVPSSQGGSNEATNLVTSCGCCNRKHATRHIDFFLGLLAQEKGLEDIGLARFVYERRQVARIQMERPINRKLAKAIIEGKELTLDLAS